MKYNIDMEENENVDKPIRDVNSRLAKANVLAILALAKSIVSAGEHASGRSISGDSSSKSATHFAEEAMKMISDIDYPEGEE